MVARRLNFATLTLLIAGGCASDPRRAALHDEVVRLRGEYQQQRMAEDEARRRLEAKTVELFGPDARFCETYNPRSSSSYPSAYGEHGYLRPRIRYERIFPGCYVEDIVSSPLPVIRNPVLTPKPPE